MTAHKIAILMIAVGLFWVGVCAGIFLLIEPRVSRETLLSSLGLKRPHGHIAAPPPAGSPSADDDIHKRVQGGLPPALPYVLGGLLDERGSVVRGNQPAARIMHAAPTAAKRARGGCR